VNGEWDYRVSIEFLFCSWLVLGVIFTLIGRRIGIRGSASEVARLKRLLDSANSAALELYRKNGPDGIR